MNELHFIKPPATGKTPLRFVFKARSCGKSYDFRPYQAALLRGLLARIGEPKVIVMGADLSKNADHSCLVQGRVIEPGSVIVLDEVAYFVTETRDEPPKPDPKALEAMMKAKPLPDVFDTRRKAWESPHWEPKRRR